MGLSESVKKRKIYGKILFFQIILDEVIKMISAAVKAM